MGWSSLESGASLAFMASKPLLQICWVAEVQQCFGQLCQRIGGQTIDLLCGRRAQNSETPFQQAFDQGQLPLLPAFLTPCFKAFLTALSLPACHQFHNTCPLFFFN